MDLPEDRANKIEGTDFVARHHRAIVVIGFTILGLALVGGSYWHPELLPFRLSFHALGFAYNWPLLPGGRRIKALYFFKDRKSTL